MKQLLAGLLLIRNDGRGGRGSLSREDSVPTVPTVPTVPPQASPSTVQIGQAEARPGAELTTGACNDSAVAAMEKSRFDLVLMDTRMPGIDGLNATAAICTKEKDTGRDLPVCVMTAHAVKGDRERSLQAQIDGCIARPLEPNALFRTALAELVTRHLT